MSLAGDFHTLDLVDLLAWVAQRAKTGTLHARRRSTHKQVFFRQGVIHASSSNDPRETLGQCLIREHLIAEEVLFKALLRQEQERRLLGAILVSDGDLKPEQLRRALHDNAAEIVYDLFLWSEGRFDFHDDEAPRDILIDLKLDLAAVVAEGTRRRREWQAIRVQFPSIETTFRALVSPSEVPEPRERAVFDLAASGKSLVEISLETRRSHYATGVYLSDLCRRGALSVDAVRAEDAASDAVAVIQELSRTAAVRLSEGRLDAALEGYENVLTLDSLNQEAKKGLLAVAEARQRLRVPYDKVPVLRMGAVALTQQKFDPQEGFVLSRINGEWDVRSLLKLCPMPEEDALLIFVRLLDRNVITLQ